MLELYKKQNADGIRLSYSNLKYFYKSPIDFIKYINKDFEWNDSMILGSAVDCKLLEPQLFENKFIVCPKIDRRTKAGKEQYLNLLSISEAENKIIINEELNLKANLMVDQLLNNKLSKYLLNHTNESQKKVSFTYKGYQIKGIIDGIGEFEDGKNFIFDLKTTNDADPKFWSKQIINWMYHLQAYIYQTAVAFKVEKPDFYHIVIENVEPYKVMVFKFSPNMLNLGGKIFRKIMKDFEYCDKNNLWFEGYEFDNQNILEIDFPEWYNNQFN